MAKVSNRWPSQKTREITVNHNGNSYHIIYGEQINGGFCCIPNWGIGCELAEFWDVFWNTESLSRALKNNEAGRIIAEVIAEEEKRYRSMKKGPSAATEKALD